MGVIYRSRALVLVCNLKQTIVSIGDSNTEYAGRVLGFQFMTFRDLNKSALIDVTQGQVTVFKSQENGDCHFREAIVLLIVGWGGTHGLSLSPCKAFNSSFMF